MPTRPENLKPNPHMPKTTPTAQEQKILDAWGVRSTEITIACSWADHKKYAEKVLKRLGYAWTPERVLHLMGISKPPQQIAPMQGQVAI